MTTDTATETLAPTLRATRWRPRAVRVPGWLAVPARHAPGLGAILLVALWLVRRWLLSPALPAGTDMLGFVSRSAQNESVSRALSLWSSSGWGARRALTLESLLGLGARATGDPALTIKLFSLAVLIASGGLTYALAWRWFGSRLGAALSGLLYMSSQGSLSHWASGHVNVEVAIALLPLVFLLWCESVDRFDLARSCCLALAAGAIVLARPDLLLYSMPFMALYVAVRLAVAPAAGRTLGNAVRTTLFVMPATLALSLYLVLPSAAGIRARWLTAGSLFDTKQLVDRSVGAYASLLGFAREIGYLAFTGQQTWTSHPWFPFPVYAAAASVVVVLAYGALFTPRSVHTIFLGCTAVLATFMGKGLRAPFGDAYLWGVRHVPVFGNLRDPNRWLLVQGLAYALLAGVSIAWIARRLRPAHVLPVVAAVACAALLPVAPTLVTGFRTVTIAPGQQQLLERLAADREQSLVASLPYDQTYRFVQQPGYRGWEHDLGSESVAFTGHSAVGDGGWDQQAADTVAYTGSLLARGDPAFARILGSLGVKYLLGFGYPATDRHLLGTAGGDTQQLLAASMPGLEPVTGTRGGRLYRMASFSPLVSFRPNIALVLGGREGIGALADLRGVDLRSWAAFTADDVLARGGVGELLALARRASLIVVANTTPNDLAVLASTPLASLPGITSDAGLDRKSQIVPSDGSVRLGALASQVAPAAQVERSSAGTSFVLGRPRVLELWARVRSSPTAARLDFRVDGRSVAMLTPLTPSLGGFRWYRVDRRAFAPGRHALDLRVAGSPFGTGFEVDEVRLVDPTERAAVAARIRRLLRSSAARTLYAFDPAEVQPPVASAALVATSRVVSPAPNSFWSVLEPTHVRRDARAATPKGRPTVFLRPGRHFHTVLEHRYPNAVDWSEIDHLLLSLRGTGSGTRYRLLVDFDKGHHGSRPYLFTDRRPGWQLAAFTTLAARRSRPSRWSHVVSVRIASDDRDTTGRLTLGKLRTVRAVARTVALPVEPARLARVAEVRGQRLRLQADATELSLALSQRLLSSGGRVLVYPTAPIRSLPAVPVRFTRDGATTYRFRVESAHSGVLLLAQSYDRRWLARVGGSTRRPVSVFGLVNGYFLPAGTHSGSVGFTGQRYAELGAGASALSLVALIGLGLGSRRGRRGWDA